MKKRICILLTAALVVSLIAVLVPAVAAARTPAAGDVDLQQSADAELPAQELPAEVETVNPYLGDDDYGVLPNFWYLWNPSRYGISQSVNASDSVNGQEIGALQSAVNAVVGGNGVVDLTLTPDAVTDDRIVVPFDRNITIDYNGQYMEASFNRGITYRDADGNFHYYSDPTFVFMDEGVDIDVCCLWGDFPDFLEGKYLVRPENGEDVLVFDELTGDCISFVAGDYLFTWVGDAEDYFAGLSQDADLSAD